MLGRLALVALVALLATATVPAAPSPAQDSRGPEPPIQPPTQVRDCAVEIDAFLKRLELLEARLAAAEATIAILQAELQAMRQATGGAPPNVGGSATAPSPSTSRDDNFAQVMLITAVPPDHKVQEEIDKIREIIAVRTKDSNKLAQSLAGVTGRRQRESLQSQMSQIRTEIRGHNQAIARLESQLAEPRHVITAWDGARDILIYTTRDESRAITELAVGRFVVWTGRRLEAHATHDVWEATRISAGERPRRFTPRPSRPLPSLA